MIHPRAAFLRLLEVLDRLEIPYMVAGSAASSTYGISRATADVDLVARLTREDADALVNALESEFYIDAGEVRDAISRNRAFNVIHLGSSFKFDIFVLTDDGYQQMQFSRRRWTVSAVFGGDPIEFAVSAPEDLILSKLRWYRQGGEVSERQWNDVLSVVSVQRQILDLDYLSTWARYLGVDDLLEAALREPHEPRGWK